MIFLSSPYTGTAQQEADRFATASDCVAALFTRGLIAISPIVHWHSTALRLAMHKDASMFEAWNHTLLLRCNSVYVLEISGWRESKGVQMEIEWARIDAKPLKRVIPQGGSYLICDWK